MKTPLWLLVLPVCLLISLPPSSSAAGPNDLRAVILRGLVQFSSQNEVRNSAFHLFAATLKARGIEVTDNAPWTVILEAIPAGGGGDDSLVSVSLTYARSLPEEMIAFGRKSEIMYAAMPAEKKAALPAEGKWVREMVSEEYARSYVNPVGGDIFVVPRRDLERRFGEAIEQFLALNGKLN
jgi:hypothetical protein